MTRILQDQEKEIIESTLAYSRGKVAGLGGAAGQRAVRARQSKLKWRVSDDLQAKGRPLLLRKIRMEGQLIRESTRATDAKTARSIEGKIRAELARGNCGILERKPAPKLGDFLEKEFLPYVDNTAAKESTTTYYHAGARRLLASDVASLPLDEITDQQAAQFAARLASGL